jgi:Family of unknown function (DUF5670)
MLWTVFVVLLILWALGMVSSYTLGGFIHILLVVAIVVVLIRIIQGRRLTPPSSTRRIGPKSYAR